MKQADSQTLKNRIKAPQVVVFFLAAILITLPLKNIFVSIATIAFLVTSFLHIKRESINIKSTLFIPIVFFCLMALSLLWTDNFQESLFGLQKQLTMLVLPLAFLVIPPFPQKTFQKIFRYYSFSFVLYALYYIIRAVVSYLQTNNTAAFFHNELVPYDPGAIYISVFASFALFYFVQLKKKSELERVCLFILVALIFLLSSKSVITIDFIIVICYYAFFAEIPKETKSLTILSVSAFLFFSIFYVEEVKQRFMIEYETAFVDNTLHNTIQENEGNIHHVSIKEAWNNNTFQHNYFFPGTALRVYQARIFKEMLEEQQVFFTGFGLEASQQQIRNKAKQYNLFSDYAEFNFHNQYIQTFAELGIFGLLILVVMLFFNIKNAFQSKDFLHIAFAITMIMLFLSESFFCRQRGIVFFIVLYCLFNAASKENELKEKL